MAEVHQRDDEAGAQSFTNELPTANWSDIWLALIGLGVLSDHSPHPLILCASGVRGWQSVSSGLPSDQQQALDRIFSNTGAGIGHFGAIICVPMGFFIGMGILFVSAKIFGGAG